MRPLLVMLLLAVSLSFASGRAQPPPKLSRVYPLGGQLGTTVPVEILGERLSDAARLEFDCKDLTWERTTEESTPGKLKGAISISGTAALGSHMFRIITRGGSSNSGIFNVGQFRSIAEIEPNNNPAVAQTINAFPVEVQGVLEGAPDSDVFAFEASEKQRWVFDLRSIEEGSAVEARMLLLDAAGQRIVFNDDRNDFNENPRIEYTFPVAGKYYIKLDQYRGPRGFNFGKLSAYTLRFSALPVVTSLRPLALRAGATATLRLTGTGMDSVAHIYVTELRQAEYARMTYPYTMPIKFRPDPEEGRNASRLDGQVTQRAPGQVEVRFDVPEDVHEGVWRLWLVGANGTAEAGSLVIENCPTLDEKDAREAALGVEPLTVVGALEKTGERDVFRFRVKAGEPVHFSTLAMQLGVPFLDTVLTLRDESGKKLAENDDVVAGQGTLLGNPDSSLFYTPKQDGTVSLEVHDRLRRGGTGYEYCIKVERRAPSFQLFTTPENVTAAQGGVAEIKVHLVREEGFEGEVDIWFEGLPDGIRAERSQFRADQLFIPNADGADMVIPEITFRIAIPPASPPASYPVRVYGRAARTPQREPVEAHATLMLGPLLDVWNYVRRPLPQITLTVTEGSSSEQKP